MSARRQGLDGSVPDRCPLALLLVDVVNDFDFEHGPELLAQALPAAERIAELKRAARAAGVPSIYVNDNFGRWQSDFKALVAHCRRDGGRGAPLARLLPPARDDYFVLKPKHSGFYSTPLDLLLGYLGARTLVLTGFAGDSCVLATASDAHMRDYDLVVPADCVASNTAEANRRALTLLRTALGADTTASTELDLAALAAAAGTRGRGGR